MCYTYLSIPTSSKLEDDFVDFVVPQAYDTALYRSLGSCKMPLGAPRRSFWGDRRHLVLVAVLPSANLWLGRA